MISTQQVDNAQAATPAEQAHIDRLIELLGTKMRADYAGVRMLRDAHPKMHGCVKASFAVAADLPEELAQGVFVEPGIYPCWVRFSNAAGEVKPDSKRDVRGIGIKLMGVPGEKLLPGQTDGNNQDILLISSERFIARNIAEFAGLVQGLFGSPLRLIGFLLTHPRVAWLTWRSLQTTRSMLEIRYFSAVAYQLGERVVKYVLTPVRTGAASEPDPTNPDFLRADLAGQLRQGAVAYEFGVQCQNDTVGQPAGDPTVAWPEADCPVRTLATLTLEQQDIEPAGRGTFGDNLSFNPWRCLAAHRPLGSFGRARLQVYLALAAMRHERNAAELTEPSPNDAQWRD